METVRDAVVAGQFYAGTKEVLTRELGSLVIENAAKINAIGVVSPHAGYMYSGAVAGSVFSSIKPVANYIVIGPNHTGMGTRFGISTADSWRTPLGEAKLNRDFIDSLMENCKELSADDLSSQFEHSIEVQLPLLQHTCKKFEFMPIVVSQAPLAAYREIGLSIAKTIQEMNLEKNVTIVASSDMTHYESQDLARTKDSAAIESILALDEEGLVGKISRMRISMCGYAPVAIMIAAAKKLGAKKGKLIKYATSGDITGDKSSVVGYAGIMVY